jgi:hypothetical protein
VGQLDTGCARRARAGDWLYIGPTGPHIVGRSLDVLAGHRGSLCFYVDLDP